MVVPGSVAGHIGKFETGHYLLGGGNRPVAAEFDQSRHSQYKRNDVLGPTPVSCMFVGVNIISVENDYHI